MRTTRRRFVQGTLAAAAFSGASGAFDLGYVGGTETTGAVSWTSDAQTGGSSVTFSKTIYATGGRAVAGI